MEISVTFFRCQRCGCGKRCNRFICRPANRDGCCPFLAGGLMMDRLRRDGSGTYPVHRIIFGSQFITFLDQGHRIGMLGRCLFLVEPGGQRFYFPLEFPYLRVFFRRLVKSGHPAVELPVGFLRGDDRIGTSLCFLFRLYIQIIFADFLQSFLLASLPFFIAFLFVNLAFIVFGSFDRRCRNGCIQSDDTFGRFCIIRIKKESYKAETQ